MKEYDICVFYAAPYMSGSAYDAFEYYKFLKNKGYKVCAVISTDLPNYKMVDAILDRYKIDIVDLDYDGDLHLISQFHDLKLIRIKCKLLISTSTYSMSQIILKPIIIQYDRALMFHETTFDSDYVTKAFNGRLKDKIEMIRDDRCFGVLEPYNHITYKKKLYFNLFKNIDKDKVDNACMINMATRHKLQSVDAIYKAIKKFEYKKYIIYTQFTTYHFYRDMASSNIDVIIAPINNYLYSFNSFIYFQSNRRQDPSPRIIPECVFYDKKLEFYEYNKNIKDGAYYRYKDTIEDFDSIVLKDDDEILDIINDRL